MLGGGLRGSRPRSRGACERGLAREQRAEALLCREDSADDELRRDGAVPAVLLQPERDVVTSGTAVRIEALPEPEGDRAAGVEAVTPHPEAQVFPLADRREIAELATGCKQ